WPRSDDEVGRPAAEAVARLTEQLLEAELPDGGLEAGVDGAFDDPRDLVLRIAGDRAAAGRGRQRLQDLGDRDVGGGAGQLVTAARSALADYEARLAQLADDFLQIPRGNRLLLRDDMGRGVSPVSDMTKGAQAVSSFGRKLHFP